MTSRAIASASGFPPKVEPCSPGRRTPRTSLREATAEIELFGDQVVVALHIRNECECAFSSSFETCWFENLRADVGVQP